MHAVWDGELLSVDKGYVEYLVGLGLAQPTIGRYARIMAVAVAWCQARGLELVDVSAVDVAAFVAAVVPFTHSSRGQVAAALRHYWEWRGRVNPPLRAIRVPPQPQLVCKAVEEDEARALAKTAMGWWPQGTAVLFGLYLALRREEIACAEWSRFSDDMKWYTVTGKNSKTATLPVHPILRDELAGGGSGWVFRGRFGSHVHVATIWAWSKQVAEAAGIEHFTTHQLRHTALTTANDALGDLRAVQTFARHAKPSTTAGYTRTTAKRLRDVSDALDYF